MPRHPVGRLHKNVLAIYNMVLEILYPTRCAVCERPGNLLCPDCEARLSLIDHQQACKHCGAPYGRLICTECVDRSGQRQFAFNESLSVMEYDRAARTLISVYKDGNERRLAPWIAAVMARSLPLEWHLWADALCFIPADPAALRRRNFDHLQLIAGELAQIIGLPVLDLLQKNVVLDQRALTRRQRALNSSEMFVAKMDTQEAAEKLRSYPHLLLLDDVFTTGATLNAAAETLLSIGVKQLRALTLARVW